MSRDIDFIIPLSAASCISACRAYAIAENAVRMIDLKIKKSLYECQGNGDKRADGFRITHLKAAMRIGTSDAMDEMMKCQYCADAFRLKKDRAIEMAILKKSLTLVRVAGGGRYFSKKDDIDEVAE